MPTYTTYYNLAKPLANNPTDEDLWGGELNDNMDIIDAALHTIATSGAAGVPSGTVSSYAGSTAPADWLLCYGQAVSRSTYATLFSVIGTTYGVGDGATTFNLPDCRGRVDAGKDDMGGTAANRLTGSPAGGVNGNALGNTGGSQGHVLTTAQLAAHTHSGSTDSAGAHTHTVDKSTAAQNAGPSTIQGHTSIAPNATTTTSSSGTHTHTLTINAAGSDASHNNVQPTIIFNKIIKT